MTTTKYGRRGFLGAAIAVSGAMIFPAPAAIAKPEERNYWRPAHSENGWPIVDNAKLFRVEGSNQSVHLVDEDCATLLLYVARRFNYEIGTLRDGEITGHTASRAVSQSYESNYLSGTAIAIRPLLYPVGAKGLFYPNELAVIRDILSELDNTVSWGGDEDVPKESHFQIANALGHARIKNSARKVRARDEKPGGPKAGAISAFSY